MIIYVASPHGGKQENILRNARYCREVMGEGHTPASPHHNFSYLDEAIERDTALANGLELMEACSEVWFYSHDHVMSPGMLLEKEYAEKLGKKINITWEVSN
jgi:hypothetical protein